MSEQTLHLLIVDDEESIRIPLADHLRKNYYYDVDSVRDGQETLDLIDNFRGRYDVVLIDQVLEGDISGLDLLKEIKTRYSEIQVIVFTGWGMKQEEGIEILNQGAYRYIAKPFNLEELALMIRFAAEQSRIRREHEYLSALVQVSKELTHTTHLEKQLALVWNYVKEQLATPTFFIGLYDSATDTLQFHQSYDDGEPDPLADRQLGDDPAQWGVAGLVVKMKEEQAWLNHKESEKKWQDFGIKPYISGKGPSEAGICLPLLVGKKILGVLSVQSYQSQAFDQAFLNVVRTLGGQLAPAIENSRLFSELEKTKSHLEGLVEGSLDAAVFIDVHRRITVFNQRAEEMLGYTVADMRGHTVTKLYSDINQARMIWSLIDQQHKIVSHQVTLKHRDGIEIPALLSAVSVRDAEGNIIGQAGFIRDMRQIHLLEERLRALIRAGQVISGLLDTNQILQLIVESAVAAFPTTEKGSIHLYDEKSERLHIKASIGYTPRVAATATFRIGEGFAGWVYKHGVPIVSGNAQEDKRFKAFDFPELQSQKSMICTPLIVKGKVIGTLSLDNLTTYDAFKDNDIGLLSSLAAQAANAIENSRLYTETHSREQLLTTLDEASRHIRAEKEPAKLLHEVVRLASELMGCSAGGLFINYPNVEEMELTAIYGLPDNFIGTRLSYGGPIGHVAQSGTFQIISSYSDLPNQETQFQHLGFKTVIGFPLRYAGVVEAVLFIADDTGLREFDKNDQEVLGRFAAQASIALHTSQLMDKGLRRFSQLAILHRISDHIQKATDLEKILHVVLTGVTAGYGLGFNRAGLLLLDEADQTLVGRMGIGYLVEADAREAWRHHNQQGLEDFGKYLEASEQESFPPTPVDKIIRLLRLQVEQDVSDVFSRAVLEQRYQLVSQDELGVLPQAFVQAFGPALPFIVAPLIAREKVIGLLVADNKFTHAPITEEDINSLMTFANTTAVAIDNSRLITREQEAARRMRRQADRLRVLHEISTEITSTHEADPIWDSIAKHLIRLVEARRSLFLLVDLKGKRILKATGQGYPLEHLQQMTFSEVETGVSGWVLKTKEAVLIENAQSDPRNTGQALEKARVFETSPLIVAPLLIKDEVIGTLTVANSVGDPPFDEDDKELVIMLAAQAAIAYDNARQMHELEQLQKAAEALTGVLEPAQVLQQIVESACNILQADSSAVWSFDSVRNRTIPEELVAHRIPRDQLERYRKQAPTQGGTAETVMKKKWVGITDISDPQYGFIGPSTMELLKKIGARSFGGIALRAGEENLGVLYVNYNYPRDFSSEDRRVLETFANQAALALKKARLSSQVKRARDAAAVIAQIVALGKNSPEDWNANVARIKDALPCDAVTLYRYDEDTDELHYPPAMAGVKYPEKATSLPSVPESSIVWSVLRGNKTLIVEDAPSDPSTRNRRFTKEEGIKSLIAMPLKSGNRKVGVMFVNYQNNHRFTQDELTHIGLFANQIAVAIGNAQLHERVKRQAERLEGLYGAGKAVTSLLTLNEILQRIVEQGWHLVGGRAGYTVIRLVEDETAQVVATYPPEELDHRLATIPGIDLRTGVNGRIGVTGRAIKAGKPQLVHDVDSDSDYIPSRPQIHSELAVPIQVGKRVIGAINVDSSQRRAFNEDDQQTLTSLASYAAIAINNAQLHERTKGQALILGALYEAGQAISHTLALDEVLRHVAEQALRIVHANVQNELFSHVALLDDDKLHIVASFPPELLGDLQKSVGEVDLRKDRKKGIAGQAALMGEAQVVPDVRSNPNYIPVRKNINIHSQLSVPLRIGAEVIGVLSIEHPAQNAFSQEEVKNIELLAAQAAVAIQNARRYQELQKAYQDVQETKSILIGRTALAWTGMISSTWGHSVNKHALTIREQIQLLRLDAAGLPDIESLEIRLVMIERLANQILEKPITPPLSAEEGAGSVPINDLIRERTRQLWANEPHQSAQLKLDLRLDNLATVRASPEWLRRALDILIDNAVEATTGVSKRRIMIRSKKIGNYTEISIRDNGHGIPPEVQKRLFLEPIKKPQGTKGQGIGLLLVQMIAQTYGGKVSYRPTGLKGTTMVIALPLETSLQEPVR